MYIHNIYIYILIKHINHYDIHQETAAASQNLYFGGSQGVLYNALMGRSGKLVQTQQHVFQQKTVPAPGMNQNPVFEKWRNEPGEMSCWIGSDFWHRFFGQWFPFSALKWVLLIQHVKCHRLNNFNQFYTYPICITIKLILKLLLHGWLMVPPGNPASGPQEIGSSVNAPMRASC